MQTATEAAKLAGELSRATGGPFGPMEENLDAVQATQSRLRRLTEAHERETFVRVLARLDAEGVATKLTAALDERERVFKKIEEAEGKAAAAVNATLDQQKAIAGELRDTPKADEARDLLKTLDRLKKRLDWLDGLREGLGALHDRTGPGAAATGTGGGIGNAIAGAGKNAGSNKALSELLAAAKGVLDGVEKDERVNASMQLLRRAAEQAAAAEQSRLLEFRRYLADIKRLRERLVVRDHITVCELAIPTVGQVHAATAGKSQSDLTVAVKALQASGRYKGDCETAMGVAVRPNDAVKRRWEKKAVAQYVEASFADYKRLPEDKRSSAILGPVPRLVATLGILQFHEGPFLSDTHLDLERTGHRHSIRLSALNAQQRADLVHQLTEGLEIYHRGGIKPEAVAELVLMAAQVGALGFIGARQ